MERTLKKLKLYGILYLILACLDSLGLILSIRNGGYSVLNLVESGKVSESLATFCVVVAFAVSAIVIISQFFLGIKGYEYGKGKGYGTNHIFVAKAAKVFLITQLIIEIAAIIAGQPDIFSVIITIIAVIVIFDYSNCARIALNS